MCIVTNALKEEQDAQGAVRNVLGTTNNLKVQENLSGGSEYE